MPRFRQVAQIQELMSNKEAIRNVGIIAHIDHGKTTLADSLLYGAGMLASSMAGTARVLDYLVEEQKRKITIKTANISLFYKAFKGNFIVNLVDTPGHVDFTGKVTRALRVIDGAVVVVDAVEGIMAQTEIVMRQALKERVCPVLFINKVDRLITELQFNAKQIQKKLSHIIDSFNDLIEVYGETQYKTQWRVSPQKGNVVFGSALHGWGFTVDIAKQKAIKFSDIITAYRQHDVEKLVKTIPVHRAIMDMIINTLPNPCEAQAYRIKTHQSIQENSPVERALTECKDDGPTVMYITNVTAVQNCGCIATGRVFSGRICKGSKIRLVEISEDIEVGNVYLDMGFFQEEVFEVLAGNLAKVSLPLMVKVGETLVDLAYKGVGSPFEVMSYVSEPVVTVAIEPKSPQQLSELFVVLEKMSSEDPNLHLAIHKETGEYLLSGMGELHLELAVNQISRDFGLDIIVSLPRVVYMEGITKQGVVVGVGNLDTQKSFKVQVEPMQKNVERISKDDGFLLCFDVNDNSFVNFSVRREVFSERVLKMLVDEFWHICRSGPLCGEPVRGMKVKIVDMQLDLDRDVSYEIMCEFDRAIFASFLTANPVLFEPVYVTMISVSSELVGECLRILTTHRGRVKCFKQNGLLTIIDGFIPVAETFGFSKELRSATSGRVVWQSVFDHWEELPEKFAAQVICELRKRKGLSENVSNTES